MLELWGLPAHPFFVHGAVVLVPLACLATVIIAVVPGWRRRFSLVPLFAGLVGFGATFLAVQSGEEFNELVEPAAGPIAERHEELAETTRLLVFGLLVFQIALFAYGRWLDRRADAAPPNATLAGHALAGVTCLLAVLATVWMARTGHEGAKIVWDGTLDQLRSQAE